ncbi:MAG: MBL fold metallo-hydrolase [Candidatus Nanopelagicales bacterium]
MFIVGFPAGPWATNCYVVATGPGQECIVIDPGKDAAPGVDELVAEHKLKPVAVVLTHGHIDHMWSVFPVCEARDIPAFIHPGDRKLLSNPLAGISGETAAAFAQMTGGRMKFSEPNDVRELADQELIELAGLTLRVDHAPGHTPGSVSFLAPPGDDYPPIMFSGDLLFAGSIGRTDLPGGDAAQMMDSLARVVLPLDDSTAVLPGHGETTTIERERVTNPFLVQLADAVVPVVDLSANKRGL